MGQPLPNTHHSEVCENVRTVSCSLCLQYDRVRYTVVTGDPRGIRLSDELATAAG